MTAPATRVPTVGPVWMAIRATRASALGAGQAPAARAPSAPVGAQVWAAENEDAHGDHAAPISPFPGSPLGPQSPASPHAPCPAVTPVSTADWVTLSNSSFSRQPLCTEGHPGSRLCSCDPGFQMQNSSMCHGKTGTRMVGRWENQGLAIVRLHSEPFQTWMSASSSSPFPRPGFASMSASTSPAPTAASAHLVTSSIPTAMPEGLEWWEQGREHPMGP